MIVMMIAITPSLNASNRPLSIFPPLLSQPRTRSGPTQQPGVSSSSSPNTSGCGWHFILRGTETCGDIQFWQWCNPGFAWNFYCRFGVTVECSWRATQVWGSWLEGFSRNGNGTRHGLNLLAYSVCR